MKPAPPVTIFHDADASFRKQRLPRLCRYTFDRRVEDRRRSESFKLRYREQRSTGRDFQNEDGRSLLNLALAVDRMISV